MKSSSGSDSTNAFSTVNPPIPESNTPMGLSAGRGGILPLPAASAAFLDPAGRAALVREGIVEVVLSGGEAFADCSRVFGGNAKHPLVHHPVFHAQVRRHGRSGLGEPAMNRPVEIRPQRGECAQASVRSRHFL